MEGKWPNAKEVSDAIERHGRVIVSPVTDSMYPLIREGRDAAVLERPVFPLKKYDVALYERENGMLVLHRVVKAVGCDYVFSGDHYVQRESGITNAQICAVMTGFFHKEKYVPLDNWFYGLYCRLWCGNFFLRTAVVGAWRLVRKLTGIKKAPF